jgi:aspartyl-tRNA(Asn)/glutamyl-tRNA(Gln) amidotransferase subunit B
MYNPTIGLEIHVQLLTNSKMFCSCSTNYGDSPNANVCEICLGYPGILPSVNKTAIQMGIMFGLATNCNINEYSSFYRKNYFYPDLPKGYQITQFSKSLAENGFIDIGVRKIRIKKIHLEEDSAKLFHDAILENISIDFNRCGIPLVELVTEPDIKSPEEAYIFLEKIKLLVDYLQISTGKMEEGALRCDVNISLSQESDQLGTKVEIKNLNSFKSVVRALNYEIDRQNKILMNGEKIIQETRSYNESRDITISMRNKETVNDYRYFPEPDLKQIYINESNLDYLRKIIPETPEHAENRLIKKYNLSIQDAKLIISSKKILNFFDTCVSKYDNYKAITNWIGSEILKYLNKYSKSIDQVRLTPENLVKMISLIDDGVISGKIGKAIIEEMILEGTGVEEIIKDRCYIQLNNESEIMIIVKDILKDYKEEIETYRSGDKKVIDYFMGKAMKVTQGKANPKILKELIIEELKDNG